MSSLNRKCFDNIIKWIKENCPDLKIRIYKGTFTPSGATGEYMDKKLYIAIGACKQTGKHNWEWSIGALAHEFAHYLRELRHSDTYNQRIYTANAMLYSPGIDQAIRDRAAYWVYRDEYMTDCEAYDVVMKKWGIQEYFPDWFYWANNYTYKIKYLAATGTYFSDRVGVIKAKNHRYSLDEINRPISKAKIREIDRLVETKQVYTIFTNFGAKS